MCTNKRILDDIDPDEKETCRFMAMECTEKMYMHEIADPGLHLKWCQNCLMCKLIVEIRRLRITGLQP